MHCPPPLALCYCILCDRLTFRLRTVRKVTPYCELRSFSRTVRVRVLAVAGLRGESQVHCFPDRDLFFSLVLFSSLRSGVEGG